jgi:hypothetical protein
MFSGFLQLFILIFPLVGLIFAVRFFCALFSEKIMGQIRCRPIVHGIGACITLLTFLAYFALINASAWPPHSLELKQQRQKVLERVQSAGGWEAVRKDCTTLAETNREQGLQLSWPHVDQLPPALAVLKPQKVWFYPPQDSAVPVVHVKIFGMHATGGHSTPYYGLMCFAERNPHLTKLRLLQPLLGTVISLPKNRRRHLRNLLAPAINSKTWCLCVLVVKS